jgi:hypothetical protein
MHPDFLTQFVPWLLNFPVIHKEWFEKVGD